MITIPTRFRADTEQKLSEDDQINYPWLDQERRIYIRTSHLGKGAFSMAYLGYREGSDPNDYNLVIKVPIVRSPDECTYVKTTEYLQTIREKSKKEFLLNKTRLAGYAYAKPVIDHGLVLLR